MRIWPLPLVEVLDEAIVNFLSYSGHLAFPREKSHVQPLACPDGFLLLALQGRPAWSAAATELPNQLQGMRWHGAGMRTVLGLPMYQARLYLQNAGQHAGHIIWEDAAHDHMPDHHLQQDHQAA